jgi:hypothetical protein
VAVAVADTVPDAGAVSATAVTVVVVVRRFAIHIVRSFNSGASEGFEVGHTTVAVIATVGRGGFVEVAVVVAVVVVAVVIVVVALGEGCCCGASC